MKTARTAICILSFIAITFSVVFYPFFYFRQSQIKSEMKKLIRQYNRSQFRYFNFTASEMKTLKWLDGGKELFYEGDMYDVVETVQQGDNFKVAVIPDWKEKQLLGLMEDHQQKMPVSKKSLRLVFNLLSHFMPFSDQIQITNLYRENSYPAYQESIYYNPVTERYTPPPELFV